MPTSRIPPAGPRPAVGGTGAPAAGKLVASDKPSSPSSAFVDGPNGTQDPAAAGLGPEAVEAKRLGALLRAMLASEDPAVGKHDLRKLQAAALHVADRLFTNQFNTDGELKDQLRAKKAHYGDVAPSEQLERALFTGSVDDRQLDALAFIVRTFQSLEHDGALRAAALEKLGSFGRRQDLDVVLLAARRGDANDLYNGVNAAQRIAGRHGSGRSPLSADPVVGPLLARSTPLNEKEHALVLEAVLSRGELDLSKTKKHDGGNRNEVFFLTFKDTLPGPGGTREPIRAVWKPENVWWGKDRAYWAREVAAYEFDKAFTETGMVPVTVESVIDLGGNNPRVGSLQWMVADAKPLGKNVLEFDPQFDAFRRTDRYKQQEAKMRTLLYIFNDPDKLPNSVHRTANLQNVMVDKAERLWMIDNAYSMGAPGGQMDKSFLPSTPDPELARKLDPLKPADVAAAMGRYVRDSDASDVARRADKATEKKP